MGGLDGVAADDLRAALDEIDDAKGVMRLMVALAYEDGIPVDVLSERYGVPRSTIYHWLARFEEREIRAAATDDRRPGRPPRLDEADRRRLAKRLRRPPSACGYDAPEWSAPLVREHVAQVYGVEYSLGHARRLLRRLDA